MITQIVAVYSNGSRSLFFRTSATTGRTKQFQVHAVSAEVLDTWLASNGYRMLPERQPAAD
jgi:hypothetical protein